MKKSIFDVKNKIISRYLDDTTQINDNKSTNINILLNRVRLNQKVEKQKKFFFSAAASMGLILFGFIIF